MKARRSTQTRHAENGGSTGAWAIVENPGHVPQLQWVGPRHPSPLPKTHSDALWTGTHQLKEMLGGQTRRADGKAVLEAHRDGSFTLQTPAGYVYTYRDDAGGETSVTMHAPGLEPIRLM